MLSLVKRALARDAEESGDARFQGERRHEPEFEPRDGVDRPAVAALRYGHETRLYDEDAYAETDDPTDFGGRWITSDDAVDRRGWR